MIETHTYPPPWQDKATLARNLCISERDIDEMVESGELPRPERSGGTGPLWCWALVDQMMDSGTTRCVYFVQAGEFIKIGFTTHIGNRLVALATGTPHEVKLLFTMSGSFNTEIELHDRFKHLRARGEWFRDDPEIRRFIEETKIRVARTGGLRPLGRLP